MESNNGLIPPKGVLSLERLGNLGTVSCSVINFVTVFEHFPFHCHLKLMGLIHPHMEIIVPFGKVNATWAHFLNQLTGWPISCRTWVGLIFAFGVPQAGGRYCSYLMPKQGGGTSQIKVNPNQVRQRRWATLYKLFSCVTCNAAYKKLPSFFNALIGEMALSG